LKSRSPDPGHAPFSQFFLFIFGLKSIKVNLRAKFEVGIFSGSRDIRGVTKFEKQIT